ncbi:MAG: CPBP family intramembrane metalloprotease [candidate division WOR-3 bacterium]|nr:MAG: CPBP family intramembrane metalloprotease [candidate division WOR-3 bacterium]
MLQVIRNYAKELKNIDREVLVIAVYSTTILLYAMFMRRTHFILPRDVFMERLLVVGTLYGISPFVILLAFRRTPRDYGIALGNPKVWLKDVVFFYLIFLVILFIAFKFTNLKNIYPLYRKATQGMEYFFLYQMIQLWYMIGWEFFFRGFMLFGMERSFGRMSVLVQAIAFGLAHFRKPQLEAYGAVIAGVFLGLIALRARSFLPCIILHYLILLTADVMGILM